MKKQDLKDLQIKRSLFDLVNSKGELLNGNLHIICTSPEYPNEDSATYRVYHKDGYCFDIEKDFICYAEDVDQFDGVLEDGYTYILYTEWDGFKKLDAQGLINLIKTS